MLTNYKAFCLYRIFNQNKLMRKFIFCILSIAACQLSSAQAHEEKIDYAKKTWSCLAMDYSFSPEAVENGIVAKMDKLGYKGKEEKGIFNKDKGFKVYKNALIPDISASRYDYFIKVEKKSRRDDEAAVAYLLIQKDGNDILAKLNAKELEYVKSFLSGIMPDIETSDLGIKIAAQEEVVSKAEKKLKSLQTDKEDIEKKIKKLQDDITENLKNQDSQQKEIDNQKKTLEVLRAKRKTSA